MSDQPRKRKAHAIHDSSLGLASQSPSKRRRSIPEAGSPNVEGADKTLNKKTGFERKANDQAQHENSSVENFDGPEHGSVAGHKIKEVTKSPVADDSVGANGSDSDVNILERTIENLFSPIVTTVTKTKKTTARNEISTVRDDPVTGERVTTKKKTTRSRKTTTTSTSRDRKKSHSEDPKKKTTIKEISTVREDPVTGECTTTTNKKITSSKTTTTSTSKDRKRKHPRGPNRYASDTSPDIFDRADEITAQGERETTSHGLASKASPLERSAEPNDPIISQEPAKKRRRSSDGASTLSSKRVCADAACDQEAESDDEIKPGAMRLLLKDNRKSLLESPEPTPMQEKLDTVSWMSKIEEVMWSQEEEQYTAEAWVREIEEETTRKEEEEERAETESRRIAAEAEAKRIAQSLNIGQSRFEKLPQEIRDRMYEYVLYTDKRLQLASPELLRYEGLRLHLENLEREASLVETISAHTLEEMTKLNQNMNLCINPSNRDPKHNERPISEFRLFDTSIFAVTCKIAADALAVFYDQNHLILDPGEPWAECINGYWKVSMSEATTARVPITRHLTLRIPYTFIQQTVDLLHDREDIKHLEVVMCVPEEEHTDHWHNLDYWTEPLKLLRHLRAETFRARPTLLTETVSLGMYREGNSLPHNQIYEGLRVGERGMSFLRPWKFLQNLTDVVEGRPLRHKPEDVYPENAKGQREGTDFDGRVHDGFRKIPRIGPWT